MVAAVAKGKRANSAEKAWEVEEAPIRALSEGLIFCKSDEKQKAQVEIWEQQMVERANISDCICCVRAGVGCKVLDSS